MTAYGTFETLPAAAWHVCLAGKTGSERHRVEVKRFDPERTSGQSAILMLLVLVQELFSVADLSVRI
jgi:hypothetical protein